MLSIIKCMMTYRSVERSSYKISLELIKILDYCKCYMLV